MSRAWNRSRENALVSDGLKPGETQVLLGGDLRIVLTFCRDRYAHSIQCKLNGAWLELLASIEGDHRDDWPASPPLQQLHIEQRDERHLAFLIGMAGKSHWSLSIELDPNARRVECDVACRLRTPAERLASTYHIAHPADGVRPQEALWTLDGVRCRLEAASDRAPTCISPAGEDKVEITPMAVLGEYPQTVRWKYALSLSAPGASSG